MWNFKQADGKRTAVRSASVGFQLINIHSNKPDCRGASDVLLMFFLFCFCTSSKLGSSSLSL